MRQSLLLFFLAACRGPLEASCPSEEAPILELEAFRGVYDRLDYRWTYTYDDEGRPRSREEFDGHYSSLLTYSYDGSTVTTDYDEETDGVRDWRRIETFDEAGNLLTDHSITYETQPPHGDPHHAYEVLTTYTYDADGNRLTELLDSSADGTIDWSVTRTYDEHGNLLSEVDSSGITSRWTYTYEDGELLTACTGDGGCWSYGYDDAGTMRTAVYESADGDSTVTDTFDGCGDLLTELREQAQDWTGDGGVNWRQRASDTYTRDAQGSVLQQVSVIETDTSFDADGDGTLESDTHERVSSTLTYRYTYAE